MSLTDKMTPKTDEQLYHALINTDMSERKVILILVYANKRYLLDRFLGDASIGLEIRKRWEQALGEVENFGIFNEINNPNRETIKRSSESEYDFLLEILSDLDGDLSDRWKQILKDLYM